MSITKRAGNSLRRGNYFIPEGETEPFLVLGIEHSKSGKHGHAKNRVDCISLFNKKKKSVLFPADDMVDIPEIIKKTGQLIDLDKTNQIAHVMDLNDNNMYDVDYPLDMENDADLAKKISELEANPDDCSRAIVEYWDVLNKKFLTRITLEK